MTASWEGRGGMGLTAVARKREDGPRSRKGPFLRNRKNSQIFRSLE